MDYEKRCKELVEAIKQLQETNPSDEGIQNWVNDTLYGTKESEDEKNVKDLIDELKCSLRAANCQNEACNGGHEKRIALLEWAIAWLEKQGETSPVLSNSLNIGKREDKENEGKISPKWTDEDEVNWSGIIDEIEANKSEAPDYDFETYDRFLSWLDNIKQRLGGEE